MYNIRGQCSLAQQPMLMKVPEFLHSILFTMLKVNRDVTDGLNLINIKDDIFLILQVTSQADIFSNLLGKVIDNGQLV